MDVVDASDATSTDELEEQGILDKKDFKAPPPRPLAVLALPPPPPAAAPDEEDGG